MRSLVASRVLAAFFVMLRQRSRTRTMAEWSLILDMIDERRAVMTSARSALGRSMLARIGAGSDARRCKSGRRLHRTRSMTWVMAGPNRGQTPTFFEDWPVLEAEIKAYLAERESGDPQDRGNGGKDAAGKALLNFLSIDPSKMEQGNSEKREEWDGEPDVLAYSELTRYGYEYLVEPMMKAGGYAVISKRMGIDLNARTLKDREYYKKLSPPVADNKRATDGFLALGRAREERLDAAAGIDREKRRKTLFEKQAMMDGTKREDLLPAKMSTVLGSGDKGDPGEDLRRPPGLSAGPRGPTLWKPSEEAKGPPPEPILFSLPQRANTVAVVACCALAYGRGTAQVLEKGLISQDVVNVAVPASLLLLGLNAASAVAGGSIAKNKRRSVSLWVFKGLFAGVPSILELKGLPDVDPRAGLPLGEVESNP